MTNKVTHGAHKVLITGANGFLGKNLQLQLREMPHVEAILFTREHSVSDLPVLLEDVDTVFHFAGINRPENPEEFTTGNAELTSALAQAVEQVQLARTKQNAIRVIFASSTQAEKDNPYGASKRLAENALFALAKSSNAAVYVYRLPNVFGKWCRPNYNSAVATFCHNIARGLPVTIHDPSAALSLVHVDDVLHAFLNVMEGEVTPPSAGEFATVNPVYQTTVGAVVSAIEGFKQSRETLHIDHVGTGFTRALYSTYVSYLPEDAFAYALPRHEDPRGVFVEMLKTPDAGQFSYFTAHPGVTRGGHYHHAKTEKFLVLKGQACFKFRHMETGQTHEINTSGEKPQVVETVPGWTHDITNIGQDEMIVMLWANEVFDRQKPDTWHCPV